MSHSGPAGVTGGEGRGRPSRRGEWVECGGLAQRRANDRGETPTDRTGAGTVRAAPAPGTQCSAPNSKHPAPGTWHPPDKRVTVPA